MTSASKRNPKKASAKPLEELMGELQEIVTKLQESKIPLEDSLSLFERGMTIVQEGNQRLDQVERKLAWLTQNRDGSLQTTPLQDPENAAAEADAEPEDTP